MDKDEAVEVKDGDGYVLCIWWGRAGGGFVLGGARLWSVAGPLKAVVVPLDPLLPLLSVVGCAFKSTGDTLGDLLRDGVEGAWLDAVPVEDPGDDNDGGGGDDEVAVGIHDDDDGDDSVIDSQQLKRTGLGGVVVVVVVSII